MGVGRLGDAVRRLDCIKTNDFNMQETVLLLCVQHFYLLYRGSFSLLSFECPRLFSYNLGQDKEQESI